MTFNRRIKLIAVFVLLVPLIAFIITGSIIFLSWSLGVKEAEELSVPRFLHAPLLSALEGEEDPGGRFSGIVFVIDDKGEIVYALPRAREELAKRDWNNIDDAYTEIMTNLPDITLSISVYTYKGRSGLVLYIEDFFSGHKLFRISTLIIIIVYFGLIVLPILILSFHAGPVVRSLMALENAASEIGRGNLDTPIQVSFKKKKRSIDEVKSLFDAFEKMRIELKESHDTQGRIMMAISHDLKTPLTLIKGYVEALRDGMAQSPDDVAEYADVIYDRSMLLEERINDLIYFTKLRTSDWQSRFEKISISEILNEAAEIFRNDTLIRKREFSYNSELTADMMFLGDRKFLFQVFENLFDNACRYTSNNDRIEITASASGGLAVITFEDSGAGISEEHREHIFDSFYRADSGRNTRGLGIGLTSAMTIIENHGGRIYYEPSKIGGAGFIIELPIITA